MRVATWRNDHATCDWDQEHFDETRRMAIWAPPRSSCRAPTSRTSTSTPWASRRGSWRSTSGPTPWRRTSAGSTTCTTAASIWSTPRPSRSSTSATMCTRRRCRPTSSSGSSANLPAALRAAARRGQVRPRPLGRRHQAAAALREGDRAGRHRGDHPLPQGDVTLEEAKEGLGDDLFLLDGIPAMIFDEHWPARCSTSPRKVHRAVRPQTGPGHLRRNRLHRRH